MKIMRVLVTLPGLVATPLVAQPAPTETQQQVACMGDALRLCAQFVPDKEQIRLCMVKQRDALSLGCRQVFDASMKAIGAKK